MPTPDQMIAAFILQLEASTREPGLPGRQRALARAAALALLKLEKGAYQDKSRTEDGSIPARVEQALLCYNPYCLTNTELAEVIDSTPGSIKTRRSYLRTEFFAPYDLDSSFVTERLRKYPPLPFGLGGLEPKETGQLFLPAYGGKPQTDGMDFYPFRLEMLWPLGRALYCREIAQHKLPCCPYTAMPLEELRTTVDLGELFEHDYTLEPDLSEANLVFAGLIYAARTIMNLPERGVSLYIYPPASRLQTIHRKGAVGVLRTYLEDFCLATQIPSISLECLFRWAGEMNEELARARNELRRHPLGSLQELLSPRQRDMLEHASFGEHPRPDLDEA